MTDRTDARHRGDFSPQVIAQEQRRTEAKSGAVRPVRTAADPETIVRALAAKLPPIYDYLFCVLCEADVGVHPAYAIPVHKPDCPWRMAVEWVARQPEHKPTCPVCGSTRIHVEYVDVSDSIIDPSRRVPGRMECLDCTERAR